MEKHRESKLMVELEERRTRHAKKFEGLSVKECLRIYKEEAEVARKSLGLNLPRRERVKA